jgi:hypothetical protein
MRSGRLRIAASTASVDRPKRADQGPKDFFFRSVTLTGRGRVTLGGTAADIAASGASSLKPFTLANADNTIEGAGAIGNNGDATLKLEATGGGRLQQTETVDDIAGIDDEGVRAVGIDGRARLVDDHASPSGAQTGFKGTVVGFLSDGTNSDTLDVQDINFAGVSWSFKENKAGTQGVPTLTDASHTANITLIGQYLAASQSASSAGPTPSLFQTAQDATGGTLVTTTFKPAAI